MNFELYSVVQLFRCSAFSSVPASYLAICYIYVFAVAVWRGNASKTGGGEALGTRPSLGTVYRKLDLPATNWQSRLQRRLEASN